MTGPVTNNNFVTYDGVLYKKTPEGNLLKATEEEIQIFNQGKVNQTAATTQSAATASIPRNTNIAGVDQKYGNPDAGAGAGATVTTNSKTVIKLPDCDPAFLTQLQQQGLIKAGAANGQYEVEPDKLDKLIKALSTYYNVPESMNAIEFGENSDPALKAEIQKQLQEQGVVDEQGKIVNPGKFADLAENGITVGDQTFKFKAEADGTIDVPVTTTKTTTATSKFKEIDPAVINAMKNRGGDWKGQLKELQKQGSVVIVDGKYYTNQAHLQRKDAPAITANNAPVDTTALVGNKAAQDVREGQLQEQFLLAYDTDPDNAQDTLMHTKYYKEYTKLEDALRKLNKGDVSDPKNKDYGNEVAYRPKALLARAYYAESMTLDGQVAHEYATPEELAALQKTVKTNYDNLQKQQAELLAKNPNDRTLIDQYKKYFGDVVDDNISKLSDKQLNDLAEAQAYEVGLTDVQIKHMASTQFKNRFNTQMSNVYHEYQAKIDEANKKGKTEKAAKLEREREEKLIEISNQRIETENKDRADYAAMMSRGQLNSEIGEGNFKKTNPTYETIVAQCPEAKQFIEANKNVFYKDGQFDPQAWKNFWLAKSSTRVDNDQNSHERIQDYFMALGEAQDVVRGNADGTVEEGYKGLKDLFGKNMSENAMINLARDMAETAGIVTEKNNTAGIRAGYVFGEIGKGVAGAAAADLLGNFVLSKIHIPFAGEVAGKVYGTVSGTVNGTVHYAQSGTVQGIDRFVSEYYDNGTLVGNQITEKITEHPWSAEGEVPFTKDYTKEYEKEYRDSYSGKKKLGTFHFDPLALAVGAVAGGIKGLIGMGKKHDKQDKNSEVQMYSRRDYNERTTTHTEEIPGTQQIQATRYVTNVTKNTPPVNEPIENVAQKVTVRRGHGTIKYKGQNVAYNEAEDKKNLVAQMYNLSGDELEAVFKYLITDFNGLPEKYMKGHMIPKGNTLNFPSKIPAGTIPGIDHDIDTSGFDPAKYKKKWIKIPLGNGNFKTQKAGSKDLSDNRPGSEASASVTARRRRV